MQYDTYLFIEIIESDPRVQFLRQEEVEDVIVRVYQGAKGNPVFIDCSEENIPDDIGIAYLKQLGLEDLIPALFPPEKVIEEETAWPTDFSQYKEDHKEK